MAPPEPPVAATSSDMVARDEQRDELFDGGTPSEAEDDGVLRPIKPIVKKIRCNLCDACTRPNCGKCKPCTMDKGTSHQRCKMKRDCLNWKTVHCKIHPPKGKATGKPLPPSQSKAKAKPPLAFQPEAPLAHAVPTGERRLPCHPALVSI